jgi:hypothetical protein
MKMFYSGLENKIIAAGIHPADHATPLYPQKLVLTSLRSFGRSVAIVRLRTKAMELLCYKDVLYVF